jgi:hypothetical protein
MQERPHWQNSESSDDSDGDNRSSEQAAPAPRPIERIPAVPLYASFEGEIRLREDNQRRSAEKSEADDDDDEEEEKPTAPTASPKEEIAEREVIAETLAPAYTEQLDNTVFVHSEAGVPEQAREATAEAGVDDADEAAEDDNPSRPVASVGPSAASPAPAAPRPTPATYQQPRWETPQPAPAAPHTEAYGPTVSAQETEYTAPQASEAEPYYLPPHPTEARPAPATYEPASAAELFDRPIPFSRERSDEPPLPPIGPQAEQLAPYDPAEQRANALHAPFGYPDRDPGTAYAASQPTSSRTEQSPQVTPRHGEPLAAAVGIGLIAEHIGRRRADRRLRRQNTKLAEQQQQQAQEVSTTNLQAQEQHRRFAAEQRRQAAAMERMRAAQEQQVTATYNLEQAASTYAQPQRFEAQRGGAAGQLPAAERMHQQPEHRAPVHVAPEQQMEQAQEEARALQSQQHIERSAWHEVAVDNHGREVAGAITYGHEFHQQRAHEVQQDRVTATPTAGSGSGMDASMGGQQYGPVLTPPYQQSQGTLPSGMTGPALQPGHPSHIDPQHQLPAPPKQQVASNIANPWFWLMLALIIAAFFTATLI